jgi:hypothetical protein
MSPSLPLLPLTAKLLLKVVFEFAISAPVSPE